MECPYGTLCGNFLVSKEPPHCPILLDFELSKKLATTMEQPLAKTFLAAAEVWMTLLFSSHLSSTV
ncbi:hypothetical protein IC575_010825 [Cucumis melo]